MKEILLQISDVKLIVNELFIKTGHDFSNYAFSSIRLRIETIMLESNIFNIDEFVYKIKNNNSFSEEVISKIYTPSTEMFRDPETWDVIYNNVLPKLNKKSEINIYIPLCTSGEEVYTFMLLLKKANMLLKTRVFMSASSSIHLDYIKKAKYKIKELSHIKKNLELLNTKFEIDEILDVQGDYFCLKSNFSENIVYLQHDFFNNNEETKNLDLILLRNKLILFNKKLQQNSIDIAYSKLIKGGYLVIGIGESIGKANSKKFKLYDKNENIFLKK